MPHILIVEDETIIRSALRRLLERNQYQVSEAARALVQQVVHGDGATGALPAKVPGARQLQRAASRHLRQHENGGRQGLQG